MSIPKCLIYDFSINVSVKKEEKTYTFKLFLHNLCHRELFKFIIKIFIKTFWDFKNGELEEL